MPRLFCKYLVRRSRADRFIECALGPTVDLSIGQVEWPAEANAGCPNPDAAPTFAVRRLACPPARLPELLRAEATASSVVLLSGMETQLEDGPLIEALGALASKVRYLALAAAAGPEEARTQKAFGALCGRLGIHPDFVGSVEGNGVPQAFALGGREAARPTAAPSAKAMALVCTYNEEDVIEQAVENLFGQGLDVFVVDDNSTDRTVEKLEALARSSGGRLIVDKETRRGIRHLDKEALFARLFAHAREAAAHGYGWMMYVDPDEIRCAPWQDVTLAEAFAHVERMGYNAVDFTVLDFRYAKDQRMTDAPYEIQMPHFEFGRRPGHFVQIKAWRHTPTLQADLFQARGHQVLFEGRRVFPLKFILKHYPLRGPERARKKIYEDRFPRYAPKELANGAHVQYNHFRDQEPEGWDVDALPRWDAPTRARHLVERLSGLGLAQPP